jgi:hypothetical protein
VATFEAEVSAERARDRNDAMRERGEFLGRPPYGYIVDNGRLVPDPVTAPILRRVLRLYRSLKSPAKVARALNDARVAAPQGGAWGDGTIRRILARQPGARPPATVRGSRAVPTAMFARLLRCHCGATLTPARKRYETTSGESRIWHGYTCPGARDVRSHPGRRAVPESVILAAAKAEAERLHLPDRIEIEAKAEAKRTELEARRGALLDALEARTFTPAEIQPRLDRIAAELAGIEAETQVIDVPSLDWSWPAETVNNVLRTFWEHVELGLDLLPVKDGFAWRLPREFVA